MISTLYVENAADGILGAATASAAPGHVYFLTDGDPINLWDWFRRVADELELPPIERRIPAGVALGAARVAEIVWRALRLKSEVPITHHAVAELARHHTYSIERARIDLGYEPRVSRDEGLRRTVAWARTTLL